MEVLVMRNYRTVMNWNSKSLTKILTDNRELVAKRISANPKLTKCFTILMGTMLMSQKVLAKSGDPLK